MFVQQVEREQRMAEVVEHSHEQHDVEAFTERRHVVHREASEFDLDAGHLGGEARLIQVALVPVDADDAVGATAFHFDRIEAAVAPDVEHGASLQIVGQRVRESAPFDRRVVAEEMIGCGRMSAQIDVVEPLAEVGDPLRDVDVRSHGAGWMSNLDAGRGLALAPMARVR